MDADGRQRVGVPVPIPGQRRSYLTPRQLQVLRLLHRGESNKSIARQLDTAEATIKIHVSAILRTLRASNRTEAAVRARSLGLCHSSDAHGVKSRSGISEQLALEHHREPKRVRA